MSPSLTDEILYSLHKAMAKTGNHIEDYRIIVSPCTLNNILSEMHSDYLRPQRNTALPNKARELFGIQLMVSDDASNFEIMVKAD